MARITTACPLCTVEVTIELATPKDASICACGRSLVDFHGDRWYSARYLHMIGEATKGQAPAARAQVDEIVATTIDAAKVHNGTGAVAEHAGEMWISESFLEGMARNFAAEYPDAAGQLIGVAAPFVEAARRPKD